MTGENKQPDENNYDIEGLIDDFRADFDDERAYIEGLRSRELPYYDKALELLAKYGVIIDRDKLFISLFMPEDDNESPDLEDINIDMFNSLVGYLKDTQDATNGQRLESGIYLLSGFMKNTDALYILRQILTELYDGNLPKELMDDSIIYAEAEKNTNLLIEEARYASYKMIVSNFIQSELGRLFGAHDDNESLAYNLANYIMYDYRANSGNDLTGSNLVKSAQWLSRLLVDPLFIKIKDAEEFGDLVDRAEDKLVNIITRQKE